MKRTENKTDASIPKVERNNCKNKRKGEKNMSRNYQQEAKVYVIKKLRQDKALKDDIELKAADIEEHEMGDMIEEGKEGIKFIAERLQKKKGANKNNHFFEAAAIYLVNEQKKLAKLQKYTEKKQKSKAQPCPTLGQIIKNKEVEQAIKKKFGVHPKESIPFSKEMREEMEKYSEQVRQEQQRKSREGTKKALEEKQKQEAEKKKKTQKKEKTETPSQRKQRTASMVTFSNGEAKFKGLPVSWPASKTIGPWMKENVLDPSYKKPVKVKMDHVKTMGKRTIVMKPIKASVKPRRPRIKAVFISFANVQTFYAINDARKINIPKNPKGNQKREDEYLVEDFKNNETLWGTWELEVISKGKDYIFAAPKKQIKKRDKKLEQKIKQERFKDLYNVNSEEFIGKYEIYDQGKDKMIFVDAPELDEEIMPIIDGASWIRGFQHNEQWLFRVEAIVFKRDGKRIPILKPIERVKEN